MRKTIIVIISLIVLAGSAFYIFLYPKFEIISGYNAKILCSCMFVTGLSQDQAEKVDIGFGPLWLASNTVDEKDKIVRSNVLGMHPKVAVYREGLGCTLINNVKHTDIQSQNLKHNLDYGQESWPEHIVAGNEKMQDVLREGFDKQGEEILHTRAVVVIRNGEIIGEAYSDGISPQTPLLGWSMAKSITATMAGILVKDGKWDLDDPMPIRGWDEEKKAEIKLRHVLQMTTGLEWVEDYGSVSTATVMLYGSDSMGSFAASVPVSVEPGPKWQYSSGTSNLLAMSMARFFPDQKAYWQFPYERLFAPLGIKSFTLETDASGHFVGSSYAYGSARDWAKLGLLYLQEGNWNGVQIVDSSWVKFVSTPVPESNGFYGGHFWLNADGRLQNYNTRDYWMDGFQGQQVSIHPDENLVIVRLGVTYDEKNFDFDGWIGKIKAAAAAN